MLADDTARLETGFTTLPEAHCIIGGCLQINESIPGKITVNLSDIILAKRLLR